MKYAPIDPAHLTAGVMERFAALTRPEGECIVWTGYRTEKGYGKFHLRGRAVRAHRVAYVAAMGADVPEGLDVDHLCSIRACVRPEHLEAVAHKENLRRSESVSAPSLRAESQDLCAAGHERSQWWWERTNGTGFCRKCKSDKERERQRERYNTDPEYRARVRAAQAVRSGSR